MKSVLRHIACCSVLVTALVIATATASASAATTTEPKPAAAAKTTTAKSSAATSKDDDKSAAERRAADSKFEREALDQTAFSEGEAAAAKESSGGGKFLRGVFGLIVVIGAIFGVQWLLKKWGQAKMDGIGGTAGLIDVVATTPLSQGRQLHLIRVADELVLVGSTEHAISRLGEFDARQLVGDTETGSGYALPSATRRALPAAGGTTPANDFHDMLEGSLSSGPASIAAVAAAPAAAEGGSFIQRFLHNLKMQTAR